MSLQDYTEAVDAISRALDTMETQAGNAVVVRGGSATPDTPNHSFLGIYIDTPTGGSWYISLRVQA